jgi:hypothetical protein
VKPGAGMKEILGSSSESVKSLSKKDVLIVWGGSNDISRDNTKETINQLCKFIEEKTTVNLVIMKVPFRHDLKFSSWVNKEIIKFNRQIEKRVKAYPNARLLDLGIDRSYYTNHGQHLKPVGKDLIVNKLTILIKDALAEKQPTSIQIPWQGLLEGTNQSHLNTDNLVLNAEVSKHAFLKDSEKTQIADQKNSMEKTILSDHPKRQRIKIALNNTEFLWT